MVALVDSDEIFVKGMQALFAEQNIPLSHIIKDYGLSEQLAGRLSVLIVDPYKSNQFKVSDLEMILSKNPTLKIIVITSISNKALVDDSIKLGVNAVLFKCCKMQEFINAYFKAIKGESHYCSSIYERCEISNDKLQDLTEREVEIVQLVCDGKTTAEIAEQLNRSTHTINTHRKNVLKKLNVKTPLELLKLMSENQQI